MLNPNRFYTYAYLREDRTPYYIGKGTKNRAYRKYKGEVNPPKDKSRIIFLKQNLTEEEAFRHEIYMIDVFGRKDLRTGILRNKTNGGDGISGFKHSEKSKNEMSEKRRGENNAFYGKKHLPEALKKMSEKKKGMVSVFLGKSHSQEAKNKMSNLKKGKYVGNKNPMFGKNHSQQTKDKISEANKGKVISFEVRNEMSKRVKGENNPFYNKSHSQETKDKISKANIGKICQEEHRNKISSAHNKLLRFMSPSGEIIEEITTLRKFCEKYNLSREGMSKVMKGEQQQSKGWSMPLE
jgi:group I intron endonuclease